MRRRWAKRAVLAALFLVLFVAAFFLGTAWLFQTGTIRQWVNSLDVPGRVTVSSVRVDPLMRIRCRDFTWCPEKNPVVSAVSFPAILARPSWGDLIRGRRSVTVSLETGKARLLGSITWGDKAIRISVTSPGKLSFPGPFRFNQGVSVQGTWTLMADLSVARGKARGSVSGDVLIQARNLRLRWAKSPLGPLNVTFVTGTLKGTLDRSVLAIQTIDFRGKFLNVTGSATLWMDPVTGKVQEKGTLFFQPLAGLAGSSPKIDAAIRFLPRKPQGYQLTF